MQFSHHQDINKTSAVDRNTLLVDHSKSTQDNKYKWSFFTTFSIQHRQIKEIFNKHWKVLRSDRYLGPVLPKRAGVIYRGARSIQGQIAPNVFNPPRTISFFNNAKAITLAVNAMCVYTTLVGDVKPILLYLLSLNVTIA